MSLLIDCYNVLHAQMPPALAGLDVAGLCRALSRSRWGRDRQAAIVVVCDGKPSPLGLVESPVAGIELVYSGPNRTADAVIMERIAAHSSPRRLWVISSDREIRQAARHHRAHDQSSEAFLHALAKELARPRAETPVEEKPAPDNIPPAEVEAWLAHVADPDADEPAQQNPAGPRNRADADGRDTRSRDTPGPDTPEPTADSTADPPNPAGEAPAELDPENDPDIPWPPPGTERW